MNDNEITPQSLEEDVKTLKENKSRINIGSFLKKLKDLHARVKVINGFLEEFKNAMEGKNWEQARKVWANSYVKFHGDFEYIMISRKTAEEVLNSKSTFINFYRKMLELESGVEKVMEHAAKIECSFKLLVALPEGYQNIRQAQLDKKLAAEGITPTQMKDAYAQMGSAVAVADAILAFAPKGMKSYCEFIFKSYEAMGVAVNIVDKYQRLIMKESGSIDRLRERLNERDRKYQEYSK